MIDKDLQTTPAEEMPREDWAAEAVQDGLAKDTTSRYDVTLAEKAKTWADGAVSCINLGNPEQAKEWRRGAEEVPKGKKKSPIGWLQDNSPGQYLRVRQAYQNVTGEDLE